MKKIYCYSDYRKYIQDYYFYQKSIRKSFTYRVLSARAGINSSGFYPLVVQGKRDLTDATIKKTSDALELSPFESEYFANLVRFNQAKTLKKKNMYFEQLLEVLSKKDLNLISENQYDIFSEWYHGVIRELVVCREFDNDFRKLGTMLSPPISARQARKSVELLLKLGFLKKVDGKYLQTSPVLTTGNNLKSHQIINYQVKMLKLAQEAFDRFGPYDLLSNSSTTFRISRETFELFKIKNRTYREELLKIAEADTEADQVFQLNINMFPVSNPKHKGNKNV
ncbi:MAG TPA: TIGR02147 family protein [Chitinispirillaceae bacterium]|nr:TIGR02147 family protein [Fibrobacter sp.]HLV32132.1 TIGR02147 family protein [Chitinispirillaceae bacterium]